MPQFKMRIAERTVLVRANFDSTKEYCRDYLCTGKADFSFGISRYDLDFERKMSDREAEAEGLPPRDYSDAQLEITAVQRKLMDRLFEYDCLLFHGSVVAVDGQAYLFTAKSGTGKSTHTRLWRELLGDRAVMVNDDKPILRFSEEGILVCGNPWTGKHRLGENICVPLKAICILERGEENRIRAIPAKEALLMLLQQSNRPLRTKMLSKWLQLIDALAKGTELYRLECNMGPEAARLAYETMSEKGEG